MSSISIRRGPPGLAILVALLAIVANVHYNHVAPPLGLLWSPAVAVLTCALVLAGNTAWNPYTKAGLCAGLLMAQDVGMKLYGGGKYDLGWKGLCTMLLVVSALLSLMVLIAMLWRDQQHPARHKAGAVGLFVAQLVGHLLLLAGLGLGHHIGFYLDYLD